MGMFKALVIGCGKIAGGYSNFGLATHGGAFTRHKNIKLVAGVDIDPVRGRHFAERFGCDFSSKLSAALEQYDPSIVSVCTADETHFQIVCEILSGPCVPRVIFLEKPACSTKEQYLLMERMALECGTIILVNHSRRFNLDIQNLRDRINAYEFGRLLRARATYYSGWMHNGTHIVDTLTFLLNDTLRVDRIVNVFDSPYEGDPTLEVVGVMRRQSIPVMISAIDEIYYQLFEIDLWFESARLRLEDSCNSVFLERRVLNAIGERVLEICPNRTHVMAVEPMLNAVNIIVSYLKSGDASLLQGYRLEDVSSTMETLWQGKNLHEQTRS